MPQNNQPAGLYSPRNEHDACGVGFVANLKGLASHQIVQDGLQVLVNLTHRGAVGADPLVGDGAGILTQIPHRLFAQDVKQYGFELPSPGEYGVGYVFLPQDENIRNQVKDIFSEKISSEGLTLLGWRDVPTDNSCLSKDPEIMAKEPYHAQVFIASPDQLSENTFERRLLILRKEISNKVISKFDRTKIGYYFVSLSSRTVVYKGMFLATQIGKYFQDLQNPDFESALALIHQRFSTNTFPSWDLAHPYRMVAHNGEINTPAWKC